MSTIAFADTSASKPRWLLIGSLALNLFFIGLIASMAVRSLGPAPEVPSNRRDSARIESIAATLPPADAARLRAEFANRRATIEAAREDIARAQDGIRATLRAEPFDAEAMRRAMADTRAARENLYQNIGSVISTAAAEMSQAGRNKLADWRTRPRN
jgi:uncharacterized membrane protein